VFFYKELRLLRYNTPCSLGKVNGRFGGLYRFRLEGRRESQARNQQEEAQAEITDFVVGLFFNPEDGSVMFLQHVH
jgi:hypothetical protein